MPLREAIAEYLGAARTGALRAIADSGNNGIAAGLATFAAGSLYTNKRVWVEEPEYPGAHQALMMAGRNLSLCLSIMTV
ncbi:MAG: hypothetical protein ABSG16_23275 [Candidatus Acidiferrum sp.]|jgi:GntR family transcriptional regulator/MocR family aminotransferase